MTDHTTYDPRTRQRQSANPPRLAPARALVLVWCAEEPARVGEALFVDEFFGDEMRVFGRGDSADADDPQRAFLSRQRPGSFERGAPLKDGFVSRKQLAIGWHAEGMRVENVGRLPMLVEGEAVPLAVLRPGDLLEVDQQLLFLCAERLRDLPALREASVAHEFGGPDAHGVVGESPAAWELREKIAFVAARTGHALLLGESGTGKELVAQAIHARSSRASKRLVARNAATFPSGLIDAELFGNAANYPNAGMAERPGLVGEADGSTLFLDEIGELPEALQTHLLRVLDDGGEYQRLGDSRRRKSDLRLVAATNRAIESLKMDLAARFQLRLYVPGLGERAADVPLLARALLQRAASRDAAIGARFLAGWDGRSGEPRIAMDLMRALVRHRWSTHVRELDAILWTSLASSRENVAELTEDVKRHVAKASPSAAAPAVAATSQSRPPQAEVTAEAIRASLAKHAGVKDRVWRDLGLPNRFALRRLLQRFGIEDADE